VPASQTNATVAPKDLLAKNREVHWSISVLDKVSQFVMKHPKSTAMVVAAGALFVARKMMTVKKNTQYRQNLEKFDNSILGERPLARSSSCPDLSTDKNNSRENVSFKRVIPYRKDTQDVLYNTNYADFRRTALARRLPPFTRTASCPALSAKLPEHLTPTASPVARTPSSSSFSPPLLQLEQSAAAVFGRATSGQNLILKLIGCGVRMVISTAFSDLLRISSGESLDLQERPPSFFMVGVLV
jgi:hypothetical protein